LDFTLADPASGESSSSPEGECVPTVAADSPLTVGANGEVNFCLVDGETITFNDPLIQGSSVGISEDTSNLSGYAVSNTRDGSDNITGTTGNVRPVFELDADSTTVAFVNELVMIPLTGLSDGSSISYGVLLMGTGAVLILGGGVFVFMLARRKMRAEVAFAVPTGKHRIDN
jgi:hypothetical protein